MEGDWFLGVTKFKICKSFLVKNEKKNNFSIYTPTQYTDPKTTMKTNYSTSTKKQEVY